MKVIEIQFNMWDKPAICIISEFEIKKDDFFVIQTPTSLEMGKLIGQAEIEQNVFDELSLNNEIYSIIRKASLQDLEKMEAINKKKEEAMEVCKTLIEKNFLPMKLVDVYFSFDDKKIVFAFIADGRIDFRQLVKDLTRHFQRNIRLQQLGVRDEAKINGDVGSCGIVQCCKSYLKVLGNVNAEQAELQQVSHRGAERLSGICGRLKCCLRYENDLYKELAEKFPAVGSQVKTPRGKGEVTEWHILKQSVNVKLSEDADNIVEVPLESLGK